MPDLDDLAQFARERGHNLTGPLSHDQVVALADAWFPEVRFHEKERFHPVDLPDLLSIPPRIFADMSAEEKKKFRVSVRTGILPDTSTPPGSDIPPGPGPQPVIERFDPPVVQAAAGGGQRVLGSGADAADAMDDLDDLGRSGAFTYAERLDESRLEAARRFFGARRTVAGPIEPDGPDEPAPGNPRRPLHLPIVVRAELRMLLETLKHELELDDLPAELAGRGLPIDAIWSGFAVEDSFFEPIRGGGERPARFPHSAQRDILRALVLAQEAGEEPDAPPPGAIPPGWQFVESAWDVVRRFAFLEYYLVYAFNDYKEYGTAPFENEHEGDVEGCCVVFERQVLEQYAADTEEALPDALLNAAREVVPHSLITAGHEESQDLDDCKRLPQVRDRARADLLVYVAAGSHSTWLSNGSHDILDFEDVAIDLPLQLPTPLIVLGAVSTVPGTPIPILPMAAILLGIVEHFVDAEDFTSDNGVSIGPGPADPSPGSLKFDKRLEVTPLSDIHGDLGNNIYQDTPALRAALALRGFPGKWGGDASLFDKSPPWQNKTARYFRRFLRSDIAPTPVVDVD